MKITQRVDAMELADLKLENDQLREAMDAIRFLAFKHDVQYWNDAEGTDADKLKTILRIAREGNWGVNGMNRTQQLIDKHKWKGDQQ